LFKAIQDGLIPGISYSLKVVSLQQLEDDNEGEIDIARLALQSADGENSHLEPKKLSTIEYVIHHDSSRKEAMREFESK
jgi:hypothetical protein